MQRTYGPTLLPWSYHLLTSHHCFPQKGSTSDEMCGNCNSMAITLDHRLIAAAFTGSRLTEHDHMYYM